MKVTRLEKTALVSILGNAFVSAIKFLAGTMFGSVALVADAIHSFTDIIGSVAVFFGVRFSDIKSDKFPYGLYKIENFVSIFISLIIFWSGIEIFLESWEKLGSAKQITGFGAITVALVSLAIVYMLAKYKEKVGREENSPSMVSEARHSMLDAYGSIGVVLALALSLAGYPFFDPLIGLGISLLVFKAGFEIFWDSAKVLLDISLDYKTMKKIEKIAGEQKEVRVKELLARNSGRYVFVDLRLETGIKDLKKVDMLQKQCEQKIRQAMPKIDKIMIEVEFRRKATLTYAITLETGSQDSRVAQEFGSAKFFGIVKAGNEPGKKGVISKDVLENPYWNSKERKGILAAEFLAKQGVDVLLTKESLHKGGAYYALQENFIEIRKTKKRSFGEILEEMA